jgi:hypothetical protein
VGSLRTTDSVGGRKKIILSSDRVCKTIAGYGVGGRRWVRCFRARWSHCGHGRPCPQRETVRLHLAARRRSFGDPVKYGNCPPPRGGRTVGGLAHVNRRPFGEHVLGLADRIAVAKSPRAKFIWRFVPEHVSTNARRTREPYGNNNTTAIVEVRAWNGPERSSGLRNHFF